MYQNQSLEFQQEPITAEYLDEHKFGKQCFSSFQLLKKKINIHIMQINMYVNNIAWHYNLQDTKTKLLAIWVTIFVWASQLKTRTTYNTDAMKRYLAFREIMRRKYQSWNRCSY